MSDWSHLIDDAFYGAESIKLDVLEHIRTKEQRARHERVCEYQKHLFDRAQEIAEKAYRYETELLKKQLTEIRARTIDLDEMETKRLSAKPRPPAVKMTNKRYSRVRKKRSHSVPDILLTSGEKSAALNEVVLPPRPLTPDALIEQNVTYAEVMVDRNTLSQIYVPLSEQRNKKDNFFPDLDDHFDAVTYDHASGRKLKKEHTHLPLTKPAYYHGPVVTKPPGKDGTLEEEQEFKQLRSSTRRYLTQASFISRTLDKSYDRRFSRPLPKINKVSQEKLKMAQLVLKGGEESDTEEVVEKENAEEEIDRHSFSDIVVTTGPTASVYHVDRSNSSSKAGVPCNSPVSSTGSSRFEKY